MSHFLPHFSDHPAKEDLLIYEFDQFPLGSDETIVNRKDVTFLQLAAFDWSKGQRDPVTLTLLLEPTDTIGNYRRMGIAEVPNYNGLAEDGWEVKDVTII
jgi:hypothetical protein